MEVRRKSCIFSKRNEEQVILSGSMWRRILALYESDESCRRVALWIFGLIGVLLVLLISGLERGSNPPSSEQISRIAASIASRSLLAGGVVYLLTRRYGSGRALLHCALATLALFLFGAYRQL